MTLIPAGVFHTVVLPVIPAFRRLLAWPPQDPGTMRTLELDCTKWLADAGLTIVSVVDTPDVSLTAGPVTFDATTVRITVTGGTPNTASSIVFAMTLSNGDVEDVSVRVPIITL